MTKEFSIAFPDEEEKRQRFRVKRLDPILAFNIWHKFTSEWDRAGNPPIDYSEEEGEMPEYFKLGQKAWDTLIDAAKMQKSVLIHINRLRPEYMEELRKQMFDTVDAFCTYKEGSQWTPVNEELSSIFEPLDNFAVSEVTIRAFFTHFEKSFTGTKTLFLELLGETV